MRSLYIGYLGPLYNDKIHASEGAGIPYLLPLAHTNSNLTYSNAFLRSCKLADAVKSPLPAKASPLSAAELSCVVARLARLIGRAGAAPGGLQAREMRSCAPGARACEVAIQCRAVAAVVVVLW